MQSMKQKIKITSAVSTGVVVGLWNESWSRPKLTSPKILRTTSDFARRSPAPKELGSRSSGAFTRTASRLLGGSWVVISRVISRVTILITHIRGLITPLITAHEPPSRFPSRRLLNGAEALQWPQLLSFSLFLSRSLCMCGYLCVHYDLYDTV